MKRTIDRIVCMFVFMRPMTSVATAVALIIWGSWEEDDLAVGLGREGIEAWDRCSRQASWIIGRCS